MFKINRSKEANKTNSDNPCNVRREASRTFKNKKREYLKGKIVDLETNNEEKTSETCAEALITLRRDINPRQGW
jgi:hypothetical protein